MKNTEFKSFHIFAKLPGKYCAEHVVSAFTEEAAKEKHNADYPSWVITSVICYAR